MPDVLHSAHVKQSIVFFFYVLTVCSCTSPVVISALNYNLYIRRKISKHDR